MNETNLLGNSVHLQELSAELLSLLGVHRASLCRRFYLSLGFVQTCEAHYCRAGSQASDLLLLEGGLGPSGICGTQSWAKKECFRHTCVDIAVRGFWARPR